MPRPPMHPWRTSAADAGRTNLNTSCKKPYMGFLLYDNAIYSNIRV